MKNSLLTFQQVSARASLLAACVGALAVSACGGGGSSSNASTANLSAAQQNYESFVLASNGGQHYPFLTIEYSTSSTGTVTYGPETEFYTEDSSLPQSPALAGPQWMSISYSTAVPGLPVPTPTGQRYLVNGAVVIAAVPFKVQVSYNGANVQETNFASDGQTVTETHLGTSYTTVPLSGTIANSPSELFTEGALGVLTNTFNGTSPYNKQATWQPGSAYMKVTRQFVGDTVFTGDCVAPATTGTNVTPCSSTISTLEAFFPYVSSGDNTTYNLSDGQIVTLAGFRAWVANAALNTATVEYRVFYQSNGQIYSGAVARDGTTLQLSEGGSKQDFYIFLNEAAVKSLGAAVTF